MLTRYLLGAVVVSLVCVAFAQGPSHPGGEVDPPPPPGPGTEGGTGGTGEGTGGTGEKPTDNAKPALNPHQSKIDTKMDEAVDVKIAVPGKFSVNNPDIRLLARLAAAITQAQYLKGTPYEVRGEGVYEKRSPFHVDMEMPLVKDLVGVIDGKKESINQQNMPKAVPKQEGPYQPPPNLQEYIKKMDKEEEEARKQEGEVDETKPEDTKPEDTKPEDTKPEDTKPEDTKPEDTKPEDTKPEDTKPEDTKPEDTKPEDTKPEDTKPEDTKPEDTKPEDTKPEDTKPEDTKPEDTKPEDTKPEDTKPEDTKPEDTKPEDTKPEDTKPEDTNPQK